MFPGLSFLVSKVTLPAGSQRDKLVWKHSPKGDLTQKDAYEFKKQHFPKIHWAKKIWSKDIPPSKSLLVWRMMLYKLPTDEVLTSKGVIFPQFALYVSLIKNQPSIYSLNVTMLSTFGIGLKQL